ncbi:hypothetical protein, partial [Pseudomonas aeruginosa]|uniref:hypothetical protein n=1 Tax=Pseudomonas aeruginosa TaxID=287 RepID=UPI00402BBD19
MSGVDAAGNPEALRAHKEASQRQTRQELELALARLRNGNPRRVKRGAAISATTVAREAGIDRSTLYRFHEPILTAIRKFNETMPKQQLEAKQGELGEAQAKAREYREALEAARDEITAWARLRIPRHSDTQPTLIRTPVPRSFGQA